jgi:hypothetical protein
MTIEANQPNLPESDRPSSLGTLPVKFRTARIKDRPLRLVLTEIVMSRPCEPGSRPVATKPLSITEIRCNTTNPDQPCELLR